MPRLRYIDGVMHEEPLTHELPSSGSVYCPPVALPDDGWSTDAGRSIRDTREALAAESLAHTDGSPAARAWVDRKTTEAARRFIRNQT